ncbi:MAG: DNA translocase FtsK 4TM domain-containing protein [Actinomycetota bacterium]|nr:DNA translocase FtsK 4TM domain-containing protein [Actinomycetota bacterium]
MTVNKKKLKKPNPRRNTKSKPVNLVKRRTEIYGIIIIALSLLLIIGLFGLGSRGIITISVNNFLSYIFGLGKYIIPFLLLLWGISFFVKKIKYLSLRFGLGFLLLFLSLLGIFSSTGQLENIFDKVLMYSRGGIAGAGIFYGLAKLVGPIGSLIILAVLTIIALLIITKISLIEVFKKIARLVKFEKPPKVEINVPDNRQEFKPKQPKPQKAEEEKPPEVIDYSKTEEKTEVIKVDKRGQLEMPLVESEEEDTDYRLPPVHLLQKSKTVHPRLYKQNVRERAATLNQVFKDFNLAAKVTRVVRGPSVTLYELSLAPGVKVQRLLSLEDDFCVAMGSPDIRFLTPIPGKAAIGIEVPNQIRSLVTLGDIYDEEKLSDERALLEVPLGKNLSGDVVSMDIRSMPHVLIGGATNSGKSSCINSIIISMLLKVKPSQVKFIMIDPKMVELNIYNGIPHLLTPVVIEPKKAASALSWATEEMDNRFKILSEYNFKSLEEYNSRVKKEIIDDLKPLPYIVIIIDELADLMMISASEVEESICRIAQKGRAVGIHLIVATQKPVVKIITGLIQGNIPARIAFNVAKNIDSRVILDQSGAEKLIGKGDMLYKSPTSSTPLRLQGAFVTTKEIETVTNYIKNIKKAEYSRELVEKINTQKKVDMEEDDLLYEALQAVVDFGHASASLLQRKLKLGYSRAARIIDQLEEKGLISGYDGSKPREVLISKEELERILENREGI